MTSALQKISMEAYAIDREIESAASALEAACMRGDAELVRKLRQQAHDLLDRKHVAVGAKIEALKRAIKGN